MGVQYEVLLYVYMRYIAGSLPIYSFSSRFSFQLSSQDDSLCRWQRLFHWHQRSASKNLVLYKMADMVGVKVCVRVFPSLFNQLLHCHFKRARKLKNFWWKSSERKELDSISRWNLSTSNVCRNCNICVVTAFCHN